MHELGINNNERPVVTLLTSSGNEKTEGRRADKSTLKLLHLAHAWVDTGQTNPSCVPGQKALFLFGLTRVET